MPSGKLIFNAACGDGNFRRPAIRVQQPKGARALLICGAEGQGRQVNMGASPHTPYIIGMQFCRKNAYAGNSTGEHLLSDRLTFSGAYEADRFHSSVIRV